VTPVRAQIAGRRGIDHEPLAPMAFVIRLT
jgi:hypothetical protein